MRNFFMKKIEVVIDFDGTIVNVYKRYYRIFKEFYNINISEEEYIKLKKCSFNDIELISELKLDISNFDEYQKLKKEKLEKEEYLKLDTLIIAKEELLEKLKNKEFIILTIRKDKEMLYRQLKWLDLEELKNKVVVLTPKNKFIKREYVLKNQIKFVENFVCIGDAETDLEIGKIDGVKAYHVSSGLRNSKILEKDYKFIKVDSIKNIYL